MLAAADLWLLCESQRGAYTPPPLPCPGSPSEQPAALMDAFVIMANADRQLRGEG